MAMYALIDQSGNITNVIEWDGETEWCPPENHTVIPSNGTAIIGGKWDGSSFLKPEVVQ